MNGYRKCFIDTMEYYSAMRKKAYLLFDTPRIGLKGIMLSEICQREKDKYFMTSLICGNLKKKNLRQEEETSGCQRRGWAADEIGGEGG